MADDPKQRILTALEAQLQRSRQQQARLRDVLTRVLLILEHAEPADGRLNR